MLYSRHCFDLLDVPTAHRFLDPVPQHQLNQIRSLRISVIFSAQWVHSTSSPHATPQRGQEVAVQWLDICSILCKMQGLQELRLCIFRDPNHEVSERDFLLPLFSVRVRDGTFIVQLPWASDDEMELFGDNPNVPFIVERRGRRVV